MAKGPFGNPLSTGIALNFEVDMTPYRQMHARKMKKLEDEKKEKKRKAKELGSILSKVTLNEDKIFWRQHDNAKIQYADTIDKVSTMYNNEDYSGMYKAMNDFSMDMSNLMQENAVIKARDAQISKGGIYYDPALEAMKNNRDVSDADYANALEEAGYGDVSEKGIYNYTQLQDIVNVDELFQNAFKGIDKTVYDKFGKKKILGRQDQTRFLESQIPEEVYNATKEDIKTFVRSNPQRAVAFLRAKGKDVKSLAGMSQADQDAQTGLWLEEIVGGAGEKFRRGEKTVGIATPKTDPSKWSWDASGGSNGMWTWNTSKGGEFQVDDGSGTAKDVSISTSLQIERSKGGVGINNYTLGTDALVLDPAAKTFSNAGLGSNQTVKGTIVAIKQTSMGKMAEISSTTGLSPEEQEEYYRILALEVAATSGGPALLPADAAELKILDKKKTDRTYMIPWGSTVAAQTYSAMGISGNQTKQMDKYFNGGGSSTVRTITKAQAQTLMSNAGFSTEAELIADQKRLGYTLKITP